MDEKLTKFWIKSMPFIPLIIVVCLIATYAVTTISFIKCGAFFGIKCTAVNGADISQINKLYSVAEGNRRVVEIEGAFEDKKARAGANEEIACPAVNLDKYPKLVALGIQSKCKQNEIAAFEESLGESRNRYDDAKAAYSEDDPEAKKLEAQVSKQERQLTVLKAELTSLKDQETAFQTEVASIRKQISDRYSSRLIWTFFTAVYMLLCAGCLLVGFGVVFRSFEADWRKTLKSLCLTALIACLFAVFVFSNEDQYMFIFEQMFDQSLNSYNEMPFNLINFFNVVGFAASGFLITASWAVLDSINAIEGGDLSANQKLDEFVKRAQYLKTILYIGTSMLVVGMLRVDSLLDWHKAFLSTENNNIFVTIYENFTTTLFSVEGGFYTLLLGSIYLPAAYLVRLKASDLDLTDAGGNVLAAAAREQILKERGLIFSLSDFTPRLLVILSPLITGQIGELFNHFTKF